MVSHCEVITGKGTGLVQAILSTVSCQLTSEATHRPSLVQLSGSGARSDRLTWGLADVIGSPVLGADGTESFGPNSCPHKGLRLLAAI